MGKGVKPREIIQKINCMLMEHKVHNISFVTPDHFIPHILLIIEMVKKEWPDIPIVFNTSGYQSAEILKEIGDYVDIYIPDFKYSDKALATRLSLCPDYTNTALDAISEMIRQKGFLKIKDGIAKKGVLVRHLILPGKIKNSVDALSLLYGEFGKDLFISLMSQYRPVFSQKDPHLNRPLKKEEFLHVYNHALELGFNNMFVQYPEQVENNTDFLPDFRLDQPFRGNKNKMV